MAYVYSAWPTAANVQDRLTRMTQTLVLGTGEADNALAAITAHVATETQREFLPVTETRYFDGSGTGLMDVDAMVTLTSVAIIGYLALPSLSVPNCEAIAHAGKPTTEIRIFRGSLPALGRVWVDSFPRGRGNIAVTATWGYASTIPVDLWDAVLDATCQRIARQSVYAASGPLDGWKEGDVSESYKALTQEELAEYPLLKKAIERYARPVGMRLRQRVRSMV